MNAKQSRLNWADPTFWTASKEVDGIYSEDEMWKLETIENTSHDNSSKRAKITALKRKESAF